MTKCVGVKLIYWRTTDLLYLSYKHDYSNTLISLVVLSFQEKQSQYKSLEQFQNLIKEVLTWDIRSVSQRTRPHPVVINKVRDIVDEETEEDNFKEEVYPETTNALNQVVYHLILEGIDVSYRIDENSNVVVEKANVHPDFANKSRYSYLAHRDKVR